MHVLAIVGKLIGYTLLGTVVAPLITLIPMIVFYVADSHCGKPSDSGGCEMGIAAILLGTLPIGAGLGLLFGIWRAVRAHRAR